MEPRTTGLTLWLTGLPCAGKSTLAKQITWEFQQRSWRIELLDSDILRTTVCKGLGFSRADRDENIARLGWICSTLNKHGVIAVVAAVSPYREARRLLRSTIPEFVEIYIKAPLHVCMERDVKGMYAKALAGEIPHFTGLDDPYEEPLDPEIVIETAESDVDKCVGSILKWLGQRGLLEPDNTWTRGKPAPIRDAHEAK
jgi:adenylylsulfate kinase